MARELSRRSALATGGALLATGVAGGAATADTPRLDEDVFAVDRETTYGGTPPVLRVVDLLSLEDGHLVVAATGDRASPKPTVYRTGPDGQLRWRLADADLPSMRPETAVLTSDDRVVVGGAAHDSESYVVTEIGDGGETGWTTRLEGTYYGLAPLVGLADGAFGTFGVRSRDDETPILATLHADGRPGEERDLSIDAPRAYIHVGRSLGAGGCVGAGLSRESEADPGRVVVAELASDGGVVWESQVSVSGHPHVQGIAVTDRGIVVGGGRWVQEDDGTARTAFLAGLDRSGTEQWIREVPYGGWAVTDLIAIGDGLVAGVGFDGSTPTSPWTFEVSPMDGIEASGTLTMEGRLTAISAGPDDFAVAGTRPGTGEAMLATVGRRAASVEVPGFGLLAAGLGLGGAAALSVLRGSTNRSGARRD